jgi:hypothetical protein
MPSAFRSTTTDVASQISLVHHVKRNNMTRTIEATIDEHGAIHLSEDVNVDGVRRALVTILDEPPLSETRRVPILTETALLSEAALARDWLRPEEDEAWAHLK